MIGTAIIFVAVLSLLVFVHEFGHFITAKRAGIRVEEFGFGFPPRVFGVKKGDTVYSINWIPLGGFVKIKGESGECVRDKDSFASKRAPVRALVLMAGVVMNVALTWALLSFGYMIGLPQVVEDLSKYARVADPKVQVAQVLDGSPAERSGVKAGDEIVGVDGLPPLDADHVRAVASGRIGRPVDVDLVRDGRRMTLQVIPEVLKDSGRAGLGVALTKTGYVSYPPLIAPIEGARSTLVLGREIFLSFWGLIRDLVVRHKVTVELSGPVGIAILTSEAAKLGFRHLLQFAALLSLNLAIINVLPLPALDGGRVLFLAIEAVRGKAVSRRIEVAAHNIGFALLMTLVLAVTYHDVVRFGGRISDSFSSFFGG